jgi:hypothetical protein
MLASHTVQNLRSFRFQNIAESATYQPLLASCRPTEPGTPLGISRAMPDDLLNLRCGKCGRPIQVRPEDLGDATTVECSRCRRRNGKERSRTTSGDPAPSNHGLNHRTSMGAHQLSGCPRVNPAAMRAPCGLVAR